MTNIFQKLFGRFIFNKSKTSILKKHSLISYFQNSLDKETKYINLGNSDWYEFTISHGVKGDASGEEKVWMLNLLLHKDGKVSTIRLATFDTKREAEDANQIMRAKMYGLTGTMIVLLAWLFMASFAVILIQGFAMVLFSGDSSTQRVAQMQQPSQHVQQQAQMPQVQIPQPQGQPVVPDINAEAAKILSNYDAEMRKQMGETGKKVEFEEGSEASRKLIESLK